MRLLGIDYGTKRVGIALTDPTGIFASPYEVLANNKHLLPAVKSICQKEEVGKIVVGDPASFKREENSFREVVKQFAEELHKFTGLEVDFEHEVYTSKEAERIAGRDEAYDARAAALILKSYIDRQKNQK